MQARTCLFCAAVVASLAASAWAAPITNINFDDAAPGNLSDFYAPQGVVFSTVNYDSVAGTITDVSPYAVVVDDAARAISDPNVVTMAAGGNAILLSFLVPGTLTPGLVDMVSISTDALADNDPRDDAVLLFALGTNGNILAVDSAFDTETKTLLITRATTDIAKAVIQLRPAPNSTDSETFDNLSFTAPIPEPTMALLVVSGALAVLRRRRGV